MGAAPPSLGQRVDAVVSRGMANPVMMVAVLLMAGVIAALGLSIAADGAEATTGADFAVFHTAGELAAEGRTDVLYEDRFAELANEKFGGDDEGNLIYLNPPVVAQVLQPLSGLSYRTAFLVWSAVTLALTAAGLALLRAPRPFWLLAVVVPPAVLNLQLGQNGAVGLVILAGVFALLRSEPRGRGRAGGEPAALQAHPGVGGGRVVADLVSTPLASPGRSGGRRCGDRGHVGGRRRRRTVATLRRGGDGGELRRDHLVHDRERHTVGVLARAADRRRVAGHAALAGVGCRRGRRLPVVRPSNRWAMDAAPGRCCAAHAVAGSAPADLRLDDPVRAGRRACGRRCRSGGSSGCCSGRGW